jgi:hypothetical protein
MKKTYEFYAIFGLLMAMTTQYKICRNLMPCSLAKTYQVSVEHTACMNSTEEFSYSSVLEIEVLLA